MQNQTADLEWRSETVPVSTRFDDPYFSLENGLEETRHVFLQGNGLPDRFCPGFHIAELGFGTGLNFLTAALAWRATGQQGVLHFTSFEAYPMQPQEMTLALSAFAEIAELSAPLCQMWQPAGGVFEIASDLRLRVVIGDARKTVPDWNGRADAWFLDGFSPAKNPELWAPELMTAVAEHTVLGGSFATYTAAGFARRGLQDAGFAVSRVKGYGRKRHMTCGVLQR